MGVRAAVREGWLLPVAAVVAIVRAFATVPAFAVASALLMEGAGRASRQQPFSFTAPLEGAATVAASPRFLALVGGLWIAGVLLAGLLRVLFLAGALPTLGARLAGVDATRRFAPGVAWGFPRQLGTWLVGGVADLAALGYLLAVAGAIGRIGAVAEKPIPAVVLAAAGALALGLGLAGLVVSRVLGDAAAARAAILGEGPARAWAGAARRLIGRPGGFTLAGISVVLAGVAMSAALQPATGIVSSVADRVDGVLVLGPQLMLALLAVLGTAAVDLAWLATVSALACAEVAEPRVSA